MPEDEETNAINAMAQRARRKTAAERDHRVRHEGPMLAVRADAPTARPTIDGQPMVFVDDEREPGWTLFGTPLSDGDKIEIYTNVANGWVKGRFRWDGDRSSLPRLYMNLWNPYGRRDDRGLPPWVGELETYLPDGTMCRWIAAYEEVD